LEVSVRFVDAKAVSVEGVKLLSGPDLKQANTWERPNALKPKPGKAVIRRDGSVQVALPPHGLTVARLKMKD
jgi:alpha-L-arabinofuranosidase